MFEALLICWDYMNMGYVKMGYRSADHKIAYG